MRNTKSALVWIVGILNELSIPFEIDGGLAAEMYGSPRELADIDINVPSEGFYRLVPLVREYLTFGPAQYEDQEWRLPLMSLKYAGQNIDIAALGEMYYFDKQKGEWELFPEDLSGVRRMEYLGMELPFINEVRLMAYKEKLGRGVDRKDVWAMEEELKKSWKLQKEGQK